MKEKSKVLLLAADIFEISEVRLRLVAERSQTKLGMWVTGGDNRLRKILIIVYKN